MVMQTPMVGQVSWPSVLPQIAAVGLAIVLGIYLEPEDGVIWGAGAYLAYSVGSRRILTRHHRAGIALVKCQRFHEAIPEFRRSLDFFDRHPWVDRLRSVLLVSPSAMSYREMALSNIAFCYTQIGDGKLARESYEACLARFPNSGLATASLRIMEAARNADENKDNRSEVY
jgi:hypothetical protein